MTRVLFGVLILIFLAERGHAANPHAAQAMQMQALRAQTMHHAMHARAMHASHLQTEYGPTATPNANAGDLIRQMSGGHLLIAPGSLSGARVYLYPQIYAQTVKQPGNGEVMTYLRNPAAWQRNLLAKHGYELGLPRLRVVLADGTRIRAWAVPPTPPGVTRYHYFTDRPPAGFASRTWFAGGYMWEIQAPVQ